MVTVRSVIFLVYFTTIELKKNSYEMNVKWFTTFQIIFFTKFDGHLKQASAILKERPAEDLLVQR